MFELVRYLYDEEATMGELLIGHRVYQTIERPWLNNIPFKSCIPEGEYLVKAYSSKKFPDVWELQDVPGRSKILIHVANFATDVHGCIGVGLGKSGHMVLDSKKAINQLRGLLPEEFRLRIRTEIREYP